VTPGGDDEPLSITFGHGSRHLRGDSLEAVDVEKAILDDVRAREPVNPRTFRGTVTVSGIALEYRAYWRDEHSIHIGTYYPL
jgi:hypothetical protein